MSYYTKYRSYKIKTSQFAALDFELRATFRAMKPVLDVGWSRPDPEKPIKGGIDFAKMNAAYRPRFYWAGDRLTIAIPEAMSLGAGGAPGYAQESAFWADIERAVAKLGGATAGIGKPDDLPPNALG